MSEQRVELKLVGGPRDIETMFVPAILVGTQNLYISAPNAPGVYWRPRGLGRLELHFLPAPGGQFVDHPQEIKPPEPGLRLCH